MPGVMPVEKIILADIVSDPDAIIHLAVRLGAAVIVVGIGILISRALCNSIVRMVMRALGRSSSPDDIETIASIASPLRLSVIAVAAYGAGAVLDLPELAASLADKILRSLILISLFWSFLRAANPVSHFFELARDSLGQGIFAWAVEAVKVALVVVAVGAILEIWGINVAAILAGLGIFGVAVALGAQDLFRNLIAGASILVENRFEPGDWIKVDDVAEGTVDRINFRSTRIIRFDQAPLFIANSLLSDAPVTNFTRMSHRRIKWMIGVEYGSDIAQLIQIRDAIESYLIASDEFSHPPETPLFVRVDRFSGSSIDILIYCFTKTTDWEEWLQIKEKLAMKIKEIVSDAGTGFAFPSRTLYIRSPDEQEQKVAEVISVDPVAPGPASDR